MKIEGNKLSFVSQGFTRDRLNETSAPTSAELSVRFVTVTVACIVTAGLVATTEPGETLRAALSSSLMIGLAIERDGSPPPFTKSVTCELQADRARSARKRKDPFLILFLSESFSRKFKKASLVLKHHSK
jgi:hypothetical protein